MQENWLSKGRAARALPEILTKEKLRRRLRTASSCYSTEPPILSKQTSVPTTPSYHPVQRQPKTHLKLPDCLDFIPDLGPVDQDMKGKLQWQLEKAARASLSFTKEWVRGRDCQGMPSSLPPSIPVTTFRRIQTDSGEPERSEAEKICMALQGDDIRKRAKLEQACEGR